MEVPDPEVQDVTLMFVDRVFQIPDNLGELDFADPQYDRRPGRLPTGLGGKDFKGGH